MSNPVKERPNDLVKDSGARGSPWTLGGRGTTVTEAGILFFFLLSYPVCSCQNLNFYHESHSCAFFPSLAPFDPLRETILKGIGLYGINDINDLLWDTVKTNMTFKHPHHCCALKRKTLSLMGLSRESLSVHPTRENTYLETWIIYWNWVSLCSCLAWALSLWMFELKETVLPTDKWWHGMLCDIVASA